MPEQTGAARGVGGCAAGLLPVLPTLEPLLVYALQSLRLSTCLDTPPCMQCACRSPSPINSPCMPCSQGKEMRHILESNGVIHFPDAFTTGFGWDPRGALRVCVRSRVRVVFARLWFSKAGVPLSVGRVVAKLNSRRVRSGPASRMCAAG